MATARAIFSLFADFVPRLDEAADPSGARLKVPARGTPVVMLLPRKLLGLIYVAIGIFVAASKDYLENLDTIKQILSALLAILLWPLLLLGVDLHVR
jgi:hypothetical protein